MVPVLKEALRKLAYDTGALGALHRLAHRNCLTVVMFHRVLSPRDPRWAGADPEYTISDTLFAEALDFLRRHYSVVSLYQVLDALEGAGLPRRPLLVTIDDGWADTAEYALPALRHLGLPAAVFVAAGAIGRREAFWEERLYAAWRRGDAAIPTLQGGWQGGGAAGAPSALLDNSEPSLRALVMALGRAPEEARDAALASLSEPKGEPAHMLSPDQLRLLARSGIAVGVHGYSHVPLTEADPALELARARAALQRHLPESDHRALGTLSFPHGRYDATTVAVALACGFSLMFTSDPVGTPLSAGRRLTSRLLGRIDIPASAIVAPDRRLSPARMATWLFRRPAARLALDPGIAEKTVRSLRKN